MNTLLTPNIRAVLPATLLEQLRQAFSQSLFWVFVTMLLLALLGLLLILWFPSIPFEPVPPQAEEEWETGQSGPAHAKAMETRA